MYNLIATNKIENQILDSISKPVEKMGFELVRVRYFEKDKHSLQIMVDRNGTGIEIDDCAKISTTVSAILDVEDPIKFAYNLEISSPGINRPLTRKKDFEMWIGYNTKIKTW